MVRYLSDDSKSIGFQIQYPIKVKHDEYSCEFETFGFASDILGSAIGIDALDALTNAMMRVDTFLKNSNEFASRKISWCGAVVEGDFGLPLKSYIY